MTGFSCAANRKLDSGFQLPPDMTIEILILTKGMEGLSVDAIGTRMLHCKSSLLLHIGEKPLSR